MCAWRVASFAWTWGGVLSCYHLSFVSTITKRYFWKNQKKLIRKFFSDTNSTKYFGWVEDWWLLSMSLSQCFPRSKRSFCSCSIQPGTDDKLRCRWNMHMDVREEKGGFLHVAKNRNVLLPIEYRVVQVSFVSPYCLRVAPWSCHTTHRRSSHH